VRVMGIDPAGIGRDKAVISVFDFERDFAVQVALESFPKKKLNEFEGIVRDRFRRYHPFVMAIDSVGVGAQLPDDLEEDGLPVCRIFGGGSAIEKEIYHDRRSELYCRFRSWLERKKVKLLNNEDLKTQLSQMKPPFLTKRGKWQVESKDEIRKRIGKSPDELDATIYCFVKESDWAERPGVLEIHFGEPSEYSRSEWVRSQEHDEDYGHFGDVPIVG